MDAFGSIPTGGIIGDNLAYYIWNKAGTGLVIDGAIRDIEGIDAYRMPAFTAAPHRPRFTARL